MTIKNLIIGAGPAGLATAGRFSNAGIDFEIIEQSQHVGNAWRNHYDRLHLHTVKRFSFLPFMPFPEDYPTYVSRLQLVEYMDNYAKKFSIEPKYGIEITSIKKSGKMWEAKSASGDSLFAENIIIATGLNRIPFMPSWPGQESFKGSIIHSVMYKNPKPYLGKKILVVGIGNTGGEVALDLCEHDVEVCIVARGEIAVVPRDLNGKPVQETAKILEKLPFGFGDWLGSQIRKIYFGNLKKYGLNTTNVSPVILLKETGKTPLIDIGTIAKIKEGKIKVVGEMDHFRENGVQFKDHGFIEFDDVILATGYRAKIEELVEKGEELLTPQGWPANQIATGYHEGLFFVGFDNYKTGGILGTIHSDSEIVVNAIKA